MSSCEAAWQSERIRPLPASYNSLRSKFPVTTSSLSSSSSLVKDPSDVNVPSQPLLTPPSPSSPSSSPFMKRHLLPLNPLPSPLSWDRMSLAEDHEALGSSRSQTDSETPKTTVREPNSSLLSSSREEKETMEMINDPVTLIPEDEDAAAAEIAAHEEEEESSGVSSSSSSRSSSSPSLRFPSSGRKPTLRYLSAPLSDGRVSQSLILLSLLDKTFYTKDICSPERPFIPC